MRPHHALLIAAIVVAAGRAQAHDIAAGFDLLEARPGSIQYLEGPYALPADFFGPGSDPFTGSVAVVGLPIATLAGCPDPLGSTSVVLHRLAAATLPCCPGAAATPAELVALSLVSVGSITVTYGGGASSEPWNVHVGLSPTPPPPGGLLQVAHVTPDGGTFDALVPFVPRLLFVRALGPPGPPQVLDLGPTGYVEMLEVHGAPWSHTAPSTVLHTSCDADFWPGIEDAVKVVGFSPERNNRYNYSLASPPSGGPTRARRSSWGALRAIYR